MKRLFATTAIVALTAMPVMAQEAQVDANANATAEADANMPMAMSRQGNEISLENILDKDLYVKEGATAEEMEGMDIADAGADWEEVGEISDVLLGEDGSVRELIVEAGGFLGIGEESVRVSLEDITFVPDNDEEDGYFLVYTGGEFNADNSTTYDMASAEDEGYRPYRAGADTNLTEEVEQMGEQTEQTAEAAGEELEQAGENVEQTAEAAGNEIAEETQEMANDVEQATEAAGEEVAQETNELATDVEQSTEAAANEVEQEANEMATETEMATNDAMAPEAGATAEGGMTMEQPVTVAVDEVDTGELEGVRVYAGAEDWIGEIEELVITDDGEVSHAVIGVGGFLGIGERKVALPFEELTLTRENDVLKADVATTKEELEAMPEYEG